MKKDTLAKGKGMKVVILAGGFGTRLSEETGLKPKPMVEIGGKPILWHIMKGYSSYGFNDFIICLGYKGYMIKEYFANYVLHSSDVTIDVKNNKLDILQNKSDHWKITLVDTGFNSLTGGRIKRIKPYLGNKTFMMTYGDGVSDVNIPALIEHHKSHGKHATLTAVQPFGRFGNIKIGDNHSVVQFNEKPKDSGAWINGGYFVLEPAVLDYIEGDHIMFEREPLENLSKDDHLNAYQHDGFWMCMDTLRDKEQLEKLCSSNNPPWKTWKD